MLNESVLDGFVDLRTSQTYSVTSDADTAMRSDCRVYHEQTIYPSLLRMVTQGRLQIIHNK
uniref:Uncharacterized protein n=1 Tax=Octopus bimaculoides TaxID=37653 RepID=A0A0L8HPH2_OCTBM